MVELGRLEDGMVCPCERGNWLDDAEEDVPKCGKRIKFQSHGERLVGRQGAGPAAGCNYV